MNDGPDTLLFAEEQPSDVPSADLPEPVEDLDFGIERWQRGQDITYRGNGIHPSDIFFGEPEPGSVFDLDTELPVKYVHRIREIGCAGEPITVLLRKESPQPARPKGSLRARYGLSANAVVEWGCDGKPHVLSGGSTNVVNSAGVDGSFESLDPLAYGAE